MVPYAVKRSTLLPPELYTWYVVDWQEVADGEKSLDYDHHSVPQMKLYSVPSGGLDESKFFGRPFGRLMKTFEGRQVELGHASTMSFSCSLETILGKPCREL